jgi:hypothetical protein
MDQIVQALQREQDGNGIWIYPFTTAAVLITLWEAKQAGAVVPEAMVEKGFKGLQACKTKEGYFWILLRQELRHGHGLAGLADVLGAQGWRRRSHGQECGR